MSNIICHVELVFGVRVCMYWAARAFGIILFLFYAFTGGDAGRLADRRRFIYNEELCRISGRVFNGGTF